MGGWTPAFASLVDSHCPFPLLLGPGCRGLWYTYLKGNTDLGAAELGSRLTYMADFNFCLFKDVLARGLVQAVVVAW